VGPARVAIAPLQPPVQRFHHLVRSIAQDIKAEERAAARQQEREHEEEFAELPGGVSISTLEAIASCESGGDPTAVSSDGTYRGKYQFDYGTWESMGGSGDPAAAPEAEQDYRAALLYATSGSSPWPICG
jgi:transglycosylase-like protein